MNVQHINIKLFIENTDTVNLADYSAVFNTWIQKHVLDELLIDVADYLHVQNGPGLLLIGHEADYSLDNRAGRLGLLYNRKKQLEGTTQEKLVQATRALLIAAQLLEKENGLQFNTQEIQVLINDRLLVPNTMETFIKLEPELRTFFDKLYGRTEYEISYKTDPRERFTVEIRAVTRFDVETLLNNISLESAHA
ncbi:MAG TPA: hypothetical protein VFD54_16725 [Anaerolineales bacterium]|jgi:hypothetical protein|nr:hypothetical protein [Anaerolineales bacterium]